jgi:hypothetical protein
MLARGGDGDGDIYFSLTWSEVRGLAVVRVEDQSRDSGIEETKSGQRDI